jgi:nicotinamide-nucleotide amidase
VDIVVSYQYQNKKEAEKITRGIMACFDKSALKPAIWHVGSEDLTEVIIKKASIKNLTLATAESCTGGLISAALTDIPGSSKIYVGSVVSYANEVKSNILNVKNSTIEQFGAVSEEVATEMAKGMRDLTKVDLAISTTGIAGPAGGSKEKPVGSVCFGVSSARGTFSQSFRFRGDRETLRTRFTSMALYLLLEEIDRL